MFFSHCTLEFLFSEQAWHSSPHTSLWLACPQHWECSWKDPHIFVYKTEKFFFDQIKFIPWIIPAVALKTVNFVSSWKFTHKYKSNIKYLITLFYVVCMVKLYLYKLKISDNFIVHIRNYFCIIKYHQVHCSNMKFMRFP